MQEKEQKDRFGLNCVSTVVKIFISKKYGCNAPTDLISAAEIIGSDIFTKYLEGLYGKGKFIKYNKAIELIIQSKNHHKTTKDTMLQIVNQTRKTDLMDAYDVLPLFRRLPKQKRTGNPLSKRFPVPLPRIDATGFEPAASASRTQRSTKLSHASIHNS